MLVVVAVVALVVAAATYVTWLAGRLDRLHARCDGARASLDAQLVRRAAAAAALAEGAAGPRTVARTALATAARAAAHADERYREPAENDLSRALHATAGSLAPDAALGPLARDLAAAGDRVVLARRFYNDAVRDTRAVRERRLVRWLHLAGHAPLPAYFEIDDSVPPALVDAALPRPR